MTPRNLRNQLPRIGLAAAALLALPTVARCADTPPQPAQAAPTQAAPAHSPVASLFATTASPTGSIAPAGAAAVIDGHIIPMSEVTELCLKEDGASAVDRLVQRYVVDRECKRLGIVVTQAEIDQRVDELRRSIAPTSLEQGLKAHHQTRAMLEDDIRQSIARVRLVIGRVQPTKMVHCRVLLVPFAPAGAPASIAGTRPSEADAKTAVDAIAQQMKTGADFAALARQHSALAASNSGDIGILYEGAHDVDTALLTAALKLQGGEKIVDPIRTPAGFCLVQAISTDASHSQTEDAIYAEAERTYKENRAQFLVGQGIVDLLAKSHVEYYVH